MNNKINNKIEDMKNEFKENFEIKDVIIPYRIKKDIENICKDYYNTQKIKIEINENYKSLNSQKREKQKYIVLILGNTGTGKSTLINACFKEYLSKESPATPCHDLTIPKPFSHENLPDFEIYDTDGIELTGFDSINNIISIILLLKCFIRNSFAFIFKFFFISFIRKSSSNSISFLTSTVLFTSTLLFFNFITEKMKFNNFCFSNKSKSFDIKISLLEKGTFKNLSSNIK